MGEVNTLLDVALEALDGSLEESLLLLGDVTEDVDSLLGTVGLFGMLAKNTIKEARTGTYAELHRDGEEVNASLLSNLLTTGDTGEVDVAGLDKALGALGGLEELLSEAVTGISHGEGGRAETLLGLDDLITTELDAVDKSIVLVVRDGDGGSDLAEERNDGLARVATDDGDNELLGVALASDLGDEGLGTDNIEGGDAEEALGVEDTLGLEDLGGDGDGRVDGVGDNEDEGLGGDLGGNLDQTLDDTGVDVEEIIAGHARLACQESQSVSVSHTQRCALLLTGNTSGDDDDIGILEGGLGAVVGGKVAGGFLMRHVSAKCCGVRDVFQCPWRQPAQSRRWLLTAVEEM